MKRITTTLLVFCIAVFSLHAGVKDSLLNEISRAREDSSKVKLYIGLGEVYKHNNNDSAIYFFSRAVKVGKASLPETHRYLILAYQNLGVYFDMHSREDSALFYFDRALQVAERFNKKRGIAAAYNSKGVVYYRLGNYEKALESYIPASKLASELNDTSLIIKFNNNIGHIYYYQNNYEKAKQYYSLTLEIGEESEDKELISGAYQNLALLDIGQEKYQDAIDKLTYSLKVETEKQNPYGMANCYQNLAICYKHLKQYEKAIKNYQSSMEIYEEFGHLEGVAQTWINLGELEVKRGNYQEAIIRLDKGYSICLEIGSLEGQKYALIAKSEALEKLGKEGEALKVYKKYALLKDSILNESNLQQINELETKYETEKKQKEIELLTKKEELDQLKISKQQQFLTGLSIGIGLLSIMAVLITIGFIQKRKNNRILHDKNELISEQNEELHQQTEEISAQRDEIERQRKVLEIRNTEVTDSINYARKLQESILPSEEKVQELIPDSFVYYLPKDILSGDFYWIEKVKNGVLVAVVDCTGHGVPGAIMSLMGNNGLSKAVKELDLISPAKILNYLDKFIKVRVQGKSGEVKDGMDMALCLIQEKKVTYSGANNPLYVFRQDKSKPVGLDGKVEVVKADNQAIGDARKPFVETTLQLEEQDEVFMFSDGYADQFGGPKGKKFTYKRLRTFLTDISNSTAQQQKEKLHKQFLEWKGEEDQIDDVCIIGIKF